MYKKLHLSINLYIKKQHVFLLRNDDLYLIQKFLLFRISLNKQSIQCFMI